MQYTHYCTDNSNSEIKCTCKWAKCLNVESTMQACSERKRLIAHSKTFHNDIAAPVASLTWPTSLSAQPRCSALRRALPIHVLALGYGSIASLVGQLSTESSEMTCEEQNVVRCGLHIMFILHLFITGSVATAPIKVCIPGWTSHPLESLKSW